MLLSSNDDDFEIGKTILEGLGIKPSCLLNYNTKQSLKSDFKFKMVAGELVRERISLVDKIKSSQIAYNLMMNKLYQKLYEGENN